MLIRKLMLYHTQTKLQYRNRALIDCIYLHLSIYLTHHITTHHITIVLRRTTSTYIIYFSLSLFQYIIDMVGIFCYCPMAELD